MERGTSCCRFRVAGAPMKFPNRSIPLHGTCKTLNPGIATIPTSIPALKRPTLGSLLARLRVCRFKLWVSGLWFRFWALRCRSRHASLHVCVYCCVLVCLSKGLRACRSVWVCIACRRLRVRATLHAHVTCYIYICVVGTHACLCFFKVYVPGPGCSAT